MFDAGIFFPVKVMTGAKQAVLSTRGDTGLHRVGVLRLKRTHNLMTSPATLLAFCPFYNLIAPYVPNRETEPQTK